MTFLQEANGVSDDRSDAKRLRYQIRLIFHSGGRHNQHYYTSTLPPSPLRTINRMALHSINDILPPEILQEIWLTGTAKEFTELPWNSLGTEVCLHYKLPILLVLIYFLHISLDFRLY